jgi:hypothetical protein
MDNARVDVNGNEAVLRRNLAALALRSPWLAELIRGVEPCGAVAFAPSDEPGTLTATRDGRALASRRRPNDEARRWAEAIDLEEHALVVVHGFALGHHVRALAERCDQYTAILVNEPDLPLMRAVLERIDHSEWLAWREVRFVREPGDVGLLTQSLRGLEAPMCFGVTTAAHPPSEQRLAESIAAFNRAFPAALAAVRTHVITTLVQSDTTYSNALANADRYARSPGIGALKEIAKGRLGVVVSAGPSLRRNVHLLKDPAVRSRCVVVAVQTVLKPLLAMGITPDFVTAIDYAEISKRFYEGLTAEQVRGITLVSTGRANPAIPAAWPGALRMVDEEILTLALGPELSASPDGVPRGSLAAAATVAHLSYSLARHLGCDPVAMIGQDLAFTDGQYYADGAAIHSVWGGELNAFNSLEKLEWERIVRMRSYLHRRTDHLGRPVFTDEQMVTYLTQFEQMFAADREQGLTVIDATEGGVAKKHCQPMTFAEAIERYAGPQTPPVPAIPAPDSCDDPARSASVRRRLREVRAGVRRVARIARDTDELLKKLEHIEDAERANRIIRQAHANREEVHATQPAWALLQRLNQMAALKRFSADRRIARSQGLSDHEKHLRRVERDRVNVRWMSEVGDFLDRALERVDQAFDGHALADEPVISSEVTAAVAERTPVRAWAVLVDRSLDANHADGVPRAWQRTIAGVDMPALAVLGERLARSRRLRGVVVLTDRVDDATRILGDKLHGLPVRVVQWEGPADDAAEAALRATRAARRVAPACWRGGVGNLSVFDEALDAPGIAEALAVSGVLHELDVALLAGMDWCLLDPSLIDHMVTLHEESPEQFGIMFTQTVPGLSPLLLTRQNIEELARGQQENAPLSNLGGVLGYVPTQPRPDPIGRPNCLPLHGPVRDAGIRLIGDTVRGRAAIDAACAVLGDRLLDADGATIASAAMGAAAKQSATTRLPTELVVGCGTQSAGDGELGRWYAGSLSFSDDLGMGVTPDGLAGALDSLGEAVRDVVLTIGLTGWRGWLAATGGGARPADPLRDERWRELVRVAQQMGVGAIHVRTDACRPGDAQQLLDAGVDIVSIDAWANDAALYKRIAGCDAMRAVFDNLATLLEKRRKVRGLFRPWVVPRIVRCDATCESIEVFYDKWLLLASAAAIDPMPAAVPGQRIAPLTLPAFVDQRLRSERMVLLSDRCVARDDGATTSVHRTDAAQRRWAELVAEGEGVPVDRAGADEGTVAASHEPVCVTRSGAAMAGVSINTEAA